MANTDTGEEELTRRFIQYGEPWQEIRTID
jgi:hypothetical protein